MSNDKKDDVITLNISSDDNKDYVVVDMDNENINLQDIINESLVDFEVPLELPKQGPTLTIVK